MKAALAHRDHVERHHAGEHGPAAGSFSRRVATLPTPFCSETMTASCGACCAIRSAISAVSALFTVTSTMPAAVEDRGILRQRELARVKPPLGAVEIGQPQAEPLDLGLHPRAHQKRTRRPPAASMPPTKQPMAPAPATAIGRSVKHLALLLNAPAFDSRAGAAAHRGCGAVAL